MAPPSFASLVPTSKVPGTIGLGVSSMFGGRPPTAPTPWVEPPDRYTGACIESNGANFLYLGKLGNARDLNPIPDATWGLHLGDVNLALGNLVDLVGGQSRLLREAAGEAQARRQTPLVRHVENQLGRLKGPNSGAD